MNNHEDNYVTPTFKKDSFHCPHCNVLSRQIWINTYSMLQNLSDNYHSYFNDSTRNNLKRYFSYCQHQQEMYTATCSNPECEQYSVWVNETMVYPRKVNVPLAHTLMPDVIKEIYNEARQVSSISPRAAAALLRVTLEKLTIHLKETEGSLNTRIKNLTKRGWPDKVIKLLDIVRITANEGGAHAGEIDLTGADNTDIVNKLFDFVNLIVEKTIAEDQEIKSFYEQLPEDKRKGIENRDK